MARIAIGLINKSASVDDERTKRVADALQVQVRRDLGPIWAVDADVAALGAVATVPSGVWPIFIVDETPNKVAGVHTITQGVSWALVSTARDWELAASHELVEMLVDPSGEATRPGRGLALTDGALSDLDESFDYLVEACDPIEDRDHAYAIGDVLVSDFYTQEFFEAAARPGVRYSFNGALAAPRRVGRNGYLSWRDPASGRLRQLRDFGGYSIVDLPEHGGTADAERRSTRQHVDHHTPTPRTHPDLFGDPPK